METFQRVEKKYLINPQQCQKLCAEFSAFMQADDYAKSDIRSIYYDNDDFELINASIEKPFYKEKLRIRTYGNPSKDDDIYVELKKKLDGVVYKRRTLAKYSDALLDIQHCHFENEQIGKEIQYFLQYHQNLKPKIYISCLRHNFKGIKDDLRITFDSHIQYRFANLGLFSDSLDQDMEQIVMEIKTKDSYPLWLVQILDLQQIFPTSFSKVGNAYIQKYKEGKE